MTGYTMTKIQHMVLFDFKDDTSQETIDHIFSELADLKTLCPGVLHYAGGEYSSPEGLNGSFSHGFIMTFDSEESRNHYLPHPEHERVKALIIPHLDNVVAFDCKDNS